MGVEYRHFLVVDDESWHPAADTFERVNKVLASWGLNDTILEVVDLAGGKPRRTTDASIPKGLAGKAFKFDGTNGAAVARLAGPSLYECDDEERYLMNVLFVLGEDYRVHWSSDGLFFELAEQPSFAYQDEELYEIAYAESFPSTNATAPNVRLHIEDFAMKHLASKDYKGYWRAAVILDFGKDLPAFSEEVHSLPETEFVNALRNALRAESIAEVGEFY
ncbi:hypothetical protein [Duganella sp. Root1480D1]|uniref:hypothetical protein n=1 Tax=Duganella sp. Root1480D1 TaxID=1736471 RepID=UPI00070CE378|nr:hypothetical protein [Duganella sp. Root1480D1]KQZ44212.1 hypothetical protein ASD58_18560 [Duganella sp. Root1480D1]